VAGSTGSCTHLRVGALAQDSTQKIPHGGNLQKTKSSDIVTT